MSSPETEARQAPPAEARFSDELAFLERWDATAGPDGGPAPRPAAWRLSPRAVVAFVCGSRGAPLTVGDERRVIEEKFVGERGLVERAVVTLAGERGLLLVGEPGTAKSMLSELLAAAISASSELTVQGTAGTSEEHLRYGWNYGLLLGQGPRDEALVPSPVLVAMRRGALVRVEEVTRCLPEVQDALVSILSDRRVSVPELGVEGTAYARPGFNVIATANLRDRGVSEMSAALKRRFNFETVPPIADLAQEVALVERQATATVARAGVALAVDRRLLEVVVTAFRDLRAGRTHEGWTVERPSTVMSTAEAVAVVSSLGLQRAYLADATDEPLREVPGYLLGVVQKDEPKDRGRLLAYWDGAVKRRAETDPTWRALLELREVLEE